MSGELAFRLIRLSAIGGALFTVLTGALVVLLGDFVAQHLLGEQLPVGVVTGAVGAPYLLWLLATANRAGRV